MQDQTHIVHLSGSNEISSLGLISSFEKIISSNQSSLNAPCKTASNALMLTPVVSYDWDYGYHLSKLVCSHKGSCYVAYFLKAIDSRPVVRIINRESRTHSLLKDFQGRSLTLDFSSDSIPLLAVLSSAGNLRICSVNHLSNNSNSLLLSLRLTPENASDAHVSLKWGPVCDTLDSSFCKNPALLISVSVNEKVFVIDLSGVFSSFFASSASHKFEFASIDEFNQTYTPDQGSTGKPAVEVLGQSSKVYAIAFSMDSKWLLTGAHDGKVCLYRTEDVHAAKNLSPIKEWYPHSSVPICSLFTTSVNCASSPDGYLISGASNNREIKLWRFHDLSLVQTIIFLPPSVGGGGGDSSSGLETTTDECGQQSAGALAQPSLIVDFDDQSKVLLASDIKRTVLYALDLCTHPKLSLDGLAFRSISEFLLTSPCIAFDIGRVIRQTFPTATEAGENGDTEGMADTFDISLSLINPKMLQTGRLLFSVPHNLRLNKDEVEVGVEVSPPEMAEDDRSAVSPPREILLAPEALVSPVAASSPSRNSPSEVTSSITKVSELEPASACSPELTPTQEMLTADSNPAAGDTITSSLNVSTLNSSDLLAGESLHPAARTTTTGPCGDGGEDSRAVAEAEEALDGVGESHLSSAAVAAAVSSSSDSSFSSIPTAKGADSMSGPVSPDSVARSPGKQRTGMLASFRSQATSPSQQQPGSLKKAFDSSPSIDSMFTNACQRPTSPNASEVNSLLGEPHSPPMSTNLPYMNRPPPSYLSDSVRSLMGSSSSLESRPFNSRGLLPSSSSVASVGAGGPCAPPAIPNGSVNVNPYSSLSPSLSGVAFNLDELVASINKLVTESKAQTKAISTLMNKVQENKNQLNKVVSTQNTLVQKLNELSSLQQERAVAAAATGATISQFAVPPPPSSSSTSSLSGVASPSTPMLKSATSDAGVSPQWANLMIEQLRSQKTETTKRLNQLENSLKNLINTQKATSTAITAVAAAAATPAVAATSSEADAKHTKVLTEQIRNILKTELQTVFRANTPKMVEPLRQSAIRTIEDAVRNLPSVLADQMMRVLNDPKFAQYLAGHINCAVAPSLSTAYREELRGVLVPAFNNGIQLLLKDLDVILKTGLQQHLQVVHARIHDGTMASKEKIDMMTKSLEDTLNRISTELSTHISRKLKECTSIATVATGSTPPVLMDQPGSTRPDTSRQHKQSHSHLAKPTSMTNLAAANNPTPSQAPALRQKQSPPLSSDVNDAYVSALVAIRAGQLTKALELALTTTNQDLLLQVLQEMPMVQLFRQNIGQDLLLSLIHQLTCGNLRDRLELKVSFLQDALTHLNIKDETVQSHGGNIVGLLVTKLSSLMDTTLSPAEDNRVQALCRTALELSAKLPASFAGTEANSDVIPGRGGPRRP